ncbi:hypothetical protein [Streptomyces phaeochromogenes]
MPDFLSATGPLFGPDFVLVTVNDETGQRYALQVYPDASNDELRAAGQAPQYYWQPSRVYLAKKQTSPEDFDFGMTVFKGLLTSETHIGVEAEQAGGDIEAGGGFCTFTTTFAVPDSVIANAVKALRAGQHAAPKPRLGSLFFAYGSGDPDPLLGVVPIIENNVTIEVPRLDAAGGTAAPMYIDAQGAGKGSIEEHGFSSFLVTCNQLAAGAIAGSLEEGVSPFTVHCHLKEQVYIHGCQIKVTVDADKTFNQFSAALSAGGFLGISSASLEYGYSNLITTGGIITEIQMDNGVLTPELQQWVMKNADDMRTRAFNLVKSEIFDWKPTEQSPATASRGLFSSIFGGSSVSLKSNYQHRGVTFTETFRLDTTISVHQTVSGTLNDLLPAVQAHPERYLAVVDIGEHFRKIQVAGVCAVDFDDVLADGTDLRDPIRSVQLEVGYPDYHDPVRADGTVNLVTQAQGFHYTLGHKDPKAGLELAMWTEDNPQDIVNISTLRLEADIPQWPADQVKLTKTIVFDGDDPRVDLSNGGSVYTIEQTGTGHAPKLTADEVGYVFVRFMLDRILPKDNISLTLTCRIGSRTDTLTITRQNQKNALWEIYSDKFVRENSFTYSLQVEVTGPDFTDDPVIWGTAAPVTVPLPSGRLKYLNPFKLALPPVPAAQVATVNRYIATYPANP